MKLSTHVGPVPTCYVVIRLELSNLNSKPNLWPF